MCSLSAYVEDGESGVRVRLIPLLVDHGELLDGGEGALAEVQPVGVRDVLGVLALVAEDPGGSEVNILALMHVREKNGLYFAKKKSKVVGVV